MDDLETECLKVLKLKPNIIPVVYSRYVDDTFIVINKKMFML